MAGVIGLRVIEGWDWLDAVWMIAITLTTIGFGETHPLSHEGRMLMLGVITGGVGVGGYALARFTTFVIDGEFAEGLERRRRERTMRELRDHYIIIGFGRLGREVASDLVHHGEKAVVIDTDPNVVKDAAAHGAIGLHGDGSQDDVLLSAGILHCKGVAVATPSSAVNVYVTLSARQLNATANIVVRIDDASAADKARKAGADEVISPFRSGGSRISHALVHPHAAEFVNMILGREFGNLAVDDVTIGPGSKLVGKLGFLRLRDRYGAIVLAVRMPGEQIVTIPSSETAINVGSVIIAVGNPEGLSALKRDAAGR